MKDILIIRFSSLGDVVLTTGIIKYVKEQQPDINIDIITRSDFAGVFADFPYIRNVYCIDKGDSAQKLLDVLNTMPDYDGVFDLHANQRSLLSKIILPAKSWTYEKNSLARRLYVKYGICGDRLKKHTVQKYCQPLCRGLNLPLPSLEEIRPYLPSPLAQTKTGGGAKIVGIHPFASKNTKQWPFIYELCKLLLDSGIKVRVVGAGKMELPDGVEDMTGFTPLNMLIRNIAECDVFFSTDSGPMHIATALGIPLVAIFGPTSRELGFYPSFSGCTVIEDKTLSCRPCHIHGSSKCPKKHFSCMMSATIEEVRTKIMSKLNI